MQPVDVIDVDAAILFSDLLIPFTPMGLDFDFVKGEGPSIDRRAHAADVDRLRPSSRAKRSRTCSRRSGCCVGTRRPGSAHRLRRRAVHAGGVRDRGRAVDDLRADEGVHVRAAARVAPAVRSLRDDDGRLPARHRSRRACRRVQVFDSWAGALARTTTASSRCRTRREFSPALRSTGVPDIHFGVGTGDDARGYTRSGRRRHRRRLAPAARRGVGRIGHDRAVQGNLDPTLLLGPRDRLLAGADDVLRRAGGRPGHIFNLGHGVLPATALDQVQALARHVHEFRL